MAHEAEHQQHQPHRPESWRVTTSNAASQANVHHLCSTLQMSQDNHGPTQDQLQQPLSQGDSDPEESFPPSYEEAIGHIDEDGSATNPQHQQQQQQPIAPTSRGGSSSNVHNQAYNLNDEIQHSDSEEADDDDEHAYQESLPLKTGQVPDTHAQQTFMHPSASATGASSSAGSADGYASPFSLQRQSSFDHHKQHHAHHLHGHRYGHGHGHGHVYGHGPGHHLQHQHLPPGFSRPNAEPSAPPALSENPVSPASPAHTAESSSNPPSAASAAGVPYLPHLSGAQGLPFPFMNGTPLPPHFLHERLPHPAFGHLGPARFGGPGGFGPPGMFGPPPPGGFPPGVFPGFPPVPGSAFPTSPPQPPMPPQPHSPQSPPPPPAFAFAPSRVEPDASEPNRGAGSSISPTVSKTELKFGQTEASTVASPTTPSSAAAIPQLSPSQAPVSSPSTAAVNGAPPSETTTTAGTGASTLPTMPFFGMPVNGMPANVPPVPLSGIPSAPALLNAQEVSIASFTRSKRGVESQDALLDDPYQLYRFFVAHNDRPSMHVLITGSHMEKQKTEERNSDGTSAAVEHKVKVNDFTMDFDLSPYISPAGTIMTLPDPKTGNKPTLREVMEEHVEEENPFKELHMEKRVHWDYEDLTRAITQAIRSVNYRYTIEISYPIFNNKVVVHSASPLATFMRSAWTKAFCVISVVGIAIYPLREMYKKVKDKSLQSEFQMTISTRDFYMANYWNIVDQVQYK
ncbi:hypothetical protein EC968_002342 [Mortierella alpina]|nr:hypothetical protein EC968_002342 [Mortierella alpina]